MGEYDGDGLLDPEGRIMETGFPQARGRTIRNKHVTDNALCRSPSLAPTLQTQPTTVNTLFNKSFRLSTFTPISDLQLAQ
jgi:hypothetical protein